MSDSFFYFVDSSRKRLCDWHTMLQVNVLPLQPKSFTTAQAKCNSQQDRHIYLGAMTSCQQAPYLFIIQRGGFIAINHRWLHTVSGIAGYKLLTNSHSKSTV